jgi:hypothetical protein
MTVKARTSSLFAMVAALAACGGGGDDGGEPAQATQSLAGLWTGTTSNNRTAAGVGLSDGSYYVLYSVAGNPSLIAGFTQGTATVAGSSFTSSNGRDFNFEGLGVSSGTVQGTVTTRQSFAGTVTYPNSTVSFTSTYNAAFETTPLLSTIAGTYSGSVASSAGVQSSTGTISASGAFAASAAGCNATGRVTTRSEGNVYNLSVTFGPSPCIFPGQSFSGVAYYDAATRRFYGAAPNPARTSGMLFVGTKQ